MAFGYKVTNGDFLPIVKFDARSGKFFKVEKQQGAPANDIEIPPGTKFALDFGTLEAGWCTFTTQGPIRHMQPYVEGQAPVAQPAGQDSEGKPLYKPACYLKVAGNALDGVREWIGGSAAVMNAIDDLYTTCSATPEFAKGQIPIVSIPSTVQIKSGTGARSSTNYGPVFRVEGWTDRPDVLGPRTVPMKTNGHAGYTQAATPAPATPAAPPAQAQSAAAPPAGMPF